MPNAKVLSEKQAIVAELTEKIKSRQRRSGGLQRVSLWLRTPLCAPSAARTSVDYAVVKNTLVRFAINNVGMEEMDGASTAPLPWPSAHGDPIAPMRVINKFAKQFNGSKFTIKAGFMDGKVLVPGEINALAELPSKEVPAGSGPGHHAGSHHQPGHRPEGHLRAEGRLCRGRRARAAPSKLRTHFYLNM